MTMEWVGTSANADIPLPRNARRYYIPSTTHGGGGGFNANIPNNPVNCPGNNWGQGIFRANPVSETEIVNVLRVAMRNWLMTGAATAEPLSDAHRRQLGPADPGRDGLSVGNPRHSVDHLRA